MVQGLALRADEERVEAVRLEQATRRRRQRRRGGVRGQVAIGVVAVAAVGALMAIPDFE